MTVRDILLAKDTLGDTFFHAAVHSRSSAVIKALLAEIPPHLIPELLSVRSDGGRTLLHYAAQYGKSEDAVLALLELIKLNYRAEGMWPTQTHTR